MAQQEAGVDGWTHREWEFIELLTNAPPPAQRYLLRTLVELQPAPCCVHCGGEVLCTNCAFLELAGWPDAIGHNLEEITPRRRLPYVWQRIAAGDVGAYDTVIRTTYNGWRLVHVEPVAVMWDGRSARLILVQSLARLRRVMWMAGGGIRDCVSAGRVA